VVFLFLGEAHLKWEMGGLYNGSDPGPQNTGGLESQCGYIFEASICCFNV